MPAVKQSRALAHTGWSLLLTILPHVLHESKNSFYFCDEELMPLEPPVPLARCDHVSSRSAQPSSRVKRCI